MKKILTICSTLVLMLALTFTLAACGKTEYTVTLNAETGTDVVMTVGDTTVENGDKIEKDSILRITASMKDGYAGYEVKVLNGSTVLSKVAGKEYYEVKITKNTTIKVTTQEKEIESLKIKKAITKKEYFVGEELDISGLVATITYTDGDTRDFVPTVDNFSTISPRYDAATNTFVSVATIQGAFNYTITYKDVSIASNSPTNVVSSILYVYDVITFDMEEVYCVGLYDVADIVTNIKFNGETDATKAGKLSFSDFKIISGTAIELNPGDLGADFKAVAEGTSTIQFNVKVDLGIGLPANYRNEFTKEINVSPSPLQSIEWNTVENGDVPTTVSIASFAALRAMFESINVEYKVKFENNATSSVTVQDDGFTFEYYLSGTTEKVTSAFGNADPGDSIDVVISYTFRDVTKSVTYTVVLTNPVVSIVWDTANGDVPEVASLTDGIVALKAMFIGAGINYIATLADGSTSYLSSTLTGFSCEIRDAGDVNVLENFDGLGENDEVSVRVSYTHDDIVKSCNFTVTMQM